MLSHMMLDRACILNSWLTRYVGMNSKRGEGQVQVVWLQKYIECFTLTHLLNQNVRCLKPSHLFYFVQIAWTGNIIEGFERMNEWLLWSDGCKDAGKRIMIFAWRDFNFMFLHH